MSRFHSSVSLPSSLEGYGMLRLLTLALVMLVSLMELQGACCEAALPNDTPLIGPITVSIGANGQGVFDQNFQVSLPGGDAEVIAAGGDATAGIAAPSAVQVTINGTVRISSAAWAAAPALASAATTVSANTRLQVTASGVSGSTVTVWIRRAGDTRWTVGAPWRVVRANGKPVTVSRTFSVPQVAGRTFNLVIINGDPATGENRTTSGRVSVNNVQIFAPNDFMQKVDVLCASTAPGTQAKIDVMLDGAPGSEVTLMLVASDGSAGRPIANVAATTSRVGENIREAPIAVSLAPVGHCLIPVAVVSGNGSAVAPGDYQPLRACVFFSAGTTSRTAKLAIVNDAQPESDETVMVTLASAYAAGIGTASSHIVTIADDDLATSPTLAFASSASLVPESAGTSLVNLQLSAAATSAITATYTVAGSATAGSDHTLTEGTLTILAGSTNVAIPVPVVDDTRDEADETVVITLTGATGANLGASTIHTLTITDNDDPPSVSFAQAASSVDEAAGTVSIEVRLSTPSGLPVTVPLEIAGSTGVDGDHLALPASLTIPAGETTASIPVTIIDDTLDESAETIVVSFGAASGATPGIPASHTLTIADNDASPTIAFTVAESAAAENAGSVSIGVVLSAASGQPVSVPVSASGTAGDTDHGPLVTALVIPAGQTIAVMSVAITDDGFDELDETIVFTLGAPSHAGLGILTTHTLTIRDDDVAPVLAFEVEATSISEASGTATIAVSLSAASALPVTAQVATSGTAASGADFTAPVSVTIPAGSMGATITVTIINDKFDEPDETAEFTLSAPVHATLGAPAAHRLTITDDDQPPTLTFVQAASSANESAGTVDITVAIDTATGRDVTVSLTLGGTATSADHGAIPVTVVISADQVMATIAVPITDDALDEPDDILTLTLASPVNATLGTPVVHTLTIVDNDEQPTVTWAVAASAAGEAVGTVNLSVVLDTPSGLPVSVPFTVSGTAQHPADHTLAAGTVIVPAGQVLVGIVVPVVDDALDEVDETVVVTIGTPINASLGAPVTHVLTIADNDASPSVTFATSASQIDEASGPASLRVSLDAVSSLPVTVSFVVAGTASADSDHTLVASSLVIPAGALGADLAVGIVDDAVHENTETVLVTLTAADGGTLGSLIAHLLTIRDDDALPGVSFRLASSSIAENAGPASIEVVLSGPSAIPVTVTFATAGTASLGSDYGQPASLTIPAGETGGMAVVAISNDHLVEAPETVVLSLAAVVGGDLGTPAVHVLTITSDDTLRIEPIAESKQTNGDGTVTVFFGYESGLLDPVRLDPGAGNHFAPGISDRGQVAMFLPGRSPAWPNHSFSVVMPEDSLAWWLTGLRADAVRSLPESPTPPSGVTPQPQPPIARILSPRSGALIAAGEPLILSLDAADADGHVVSVALRDGANVVATLTPEPGRPLTVVLPAIAAGLHPFQVVATDNSGLVGQSDVVTVVARQRPVLNLIRIGSDPLVSGGSVTVRVSVAAGDAAPGPITLSRGGVLVATVTQASADLAVAALVPPTETLRAEVSDAAGFTVSATLALPVDVPPLVTLTHPTSGQMLQPVDGSVPLVAAASDPDGTVTQVTFLVDGVPVGTATASPYRIDWPVGAVATASIQAEATDDRGVSTRSAVAEVRINAAPGVAIVSPVDGAVIPVGTPTTISATAVDPEGSLASLVLLINGERVIESASDALSYPLPTAASGTHVLQAEAYDAQGGYRASLPIRVRVNAPPAGTILAPLPGALVQAGTPVDLRAQASDADGTVASVELLVEGQPVGSGLEATWTPSAAGIRLIALRVTDNDGAVTQTSITVTVNAQPALALLAPAISDVPVVARPLGLLAQASDSDGTITVVTFRVDGVVVGSDSTAPYTATWTPSSPGPARLSVTASDDRGGASSLSRDLVVDEAPTVALTAPAAGTVVAPGASVIFTATAADSDGSIAAVAFLSDGSEVARGTTAPYTAAAVLSSGSHLLVARAIDDRGVATDSVGVTMRVNTLPAVVLTSTAPGAAPATVVITALPSDSDGGIASITLFRDGTPLPTLTAAPWTWTVPDLPAGLNRFTARAIDSDLGAADSAVLEVRVNRPPAVSLTQPLYGTVVGELAIVDVAANAVDSDGTVIGVEFYAARAGGAPALIGSTDHQPYAIEWQPDAISSWDLTAVAVDQAGARTTSVAVRVIVNAAPTVTLAISGGGGAYDPAVGLQLLATAADSDGTVATVRFLQDGEIVGEAGASPFTLQWTGASAAPHTLQAVAVDDRGAEGRSNLLIITLNSLPSIRVTSPGIGQVFSVGDPVPVTIEASDSDGSLVTVTVGVDGGTPNVLTPPYQTTLTGLAAGDHQVVVTATDNRGGTTTTSGLTFAVNARPVVALTAPISGTVVDHGTPFTVSADASDQDGTIRSVEFYAGSIFLGSDGTAPYAISSAALPAGNHALRAEAIDDRGARAASASLAITINARPLVSLTAPAPGATIAFGTDLTLDATAIDDDGTIARVEFYDNTVLVGTAIAAPYRAILSGALPGSHALQAKAFDDRGAWQVSTAVIIGVNPPGTTPPTLEVTSPTPGQVVAVGSPIVFTATVSDPDGSVSTLEIFDGATLLTTLNAAPWSFTWNGATAGRHSLSLVATDDAGSTATLSGLVVIVNAAPTVEILSPAAGALVHLPAELSVQIRATDSDGTVARVELWRDGVKLGEDRSEPYTVSLTDLVAGNATVVARAIDNRGTVGESAPVAITLNASPTITIAAPLADQVVPIGQPLMVAVLPVASDGSVAAVEVRVDGHTVGTLTGAPWSIAVSGIPSGRHELVAVATDDRGARTSSAVVGFIANGPPTVSLTSPSADSRPNAGSPLTIAALASDVEGGMARVVFRDGTTVLGEDTTAPYTLVWTPTTGGLHSLTAQAFDIHGTSTTSTPVNLTVNALPDVAITSPVAGSVLPSAQPVTITMSASDADGSVASVRLLIDNQPLATLTSAPYTVTWNPTGEGAYAITAIARDDRGAERVTTARVTVGTANEPPTVAVVAPAAGNEVAVGAPTDLRAVASDSDGQVVMVRFRVDGTLVGEALSVPFAVSWTPTAAGPYAVIAEAMDNGGRTTISAPISFRAQEQAAALLVVITAPSSGRHFPNGSSLQVNVSVSNAIDLARVEVLLDGVVVGSDTTAPYQVAIPSLGNGDHVLTARAVDYGRSAVSAPVLISVAPDNGTGPLVAISDPANDSVEVTLLRTVMGSVTTANPAADIVAWRLELWQVDGSGEPIVMARGTGAVSAGSLGQIDATRVPNGIYDLTLTGVDSLGRSAITSRRVKISGQAKIGEFSISQTDVVIPVAGIPLAMVRTYRSFDRTQAGEFGYGWTYSLTDLQVTLPEQRRPSINGNLDPFSKRTGGSRDVTVTLPDGRRTTFRYQLDGAGFGRLQAHWIPEAGVAATLHAKNLAAGSANVIALFSAPLWWEATGAPAGDFEAYDIPGWVLTTADGTQYHLDREDLGEHLYQAARGQGYVHAWGKPYLARIVQPTGDVIEIAGNGIQHRDPTGALTRSLRFVRDGSGRISAMYDPAHQNVAGEPTGPAAVTYAYNAAGDLISAARLVDDADADGLPVYDTVRYFYEDVRFPHYLTRIVDPAGNPVRMEYDAEGRLVAMIDAEGNRTEMGHDPANRRETISDRLGNQTVIGYDALGNVVTQTDALGHTVTRTYDGRGNQLTETDALGRTTTSTYDGQNNRLSQTDALGHTTRWTYNSLGKILTEVDALGHGTTNAYDAAGRLLSTTDANGHSTTFFYNAAGHLETKTDALGHITRYAYDGSGNLNRLTDALGHVTIFAHDGNGNQTGMRTQRTLEDGTTVIETTVMAYDAQGRLLLLTAPDGSITQTRYTARGQVGSTIDALGHLTTYGYDIRGKLTGMAFADGTMERTAYDVEGRRLTHTDRMGRITRFAYDAVGRMTSLTAPDGAVTVTSFDAAGQVVSSQDALGHRTRFGYDAAGRRTSIANAFGQVAALVLDAVGNQTEFTDALGRSTAFTYDALNRQTVITFPDATTRRTGYDALGRRTSVTDQSSRVTQYGYDALSRLESVTDALNQTTRYDYDEVGNQISQTDALGRVTRYAYSSMGRREARVLPMGQRETYQYDLGGNLRFHTGFRGLVTERTYDVMNRLTTIVPDPGTSDPTVRFTYHLDGRRETMVDALGTTTYGYDNRGRLSSRATPIGTLSYTYDAGGNLTGMETNHSGGASASYRYDLLNRLNSASGIGLEATTYAFDGVGNLAQVTLPNGIQTSYGYDSLNRLRSVNAALGGAPVARYGYDLAPNGQRLSVTELSSRRVGYTYDSIDRLTSETIESTLGGLSTTIGYAHDAVGNRLSRTRTSANNGASAVPDQAFTYDSNDRLTSDLYDADGNTTLSSYGVDTYTSDNRLKSRTRPDGTVVELTYDGDGNKVRETVTGTGGLADVRVASFLIDTHNLTGYAQTIEQFDGASLAKVYLYGLDLIAQRPVSGGVRGAVRFYGYDGHGSTRYLTDGQGEVTDTYVYDAFGLLVARTGSTENRYLYAGEEFVAELGQYYNRARLLDVGRGRFWARDAYEGMPEAPQTRQHYSYVENNPTNRKDPSGFFTMAELVGTQGLSRTIGATTMSAEVLGAVQATALRALIPRVGFLATIAVTSLSDILSRPKQSSEYVYFSRGTSTSISRFGNGISLSAGSTENDFGQGFYAFEATAEGIRASASWAHQQVNKVGGQAMLLILRMPMAAYLSLSKKIYVAGPEWAMDVAAYRNGERYFSGYDVVIGPVAGRNAISDTYSNPQVLPFPNQYKFETQQSVMQLEAVNAIPLLGGGG